MALVTSNFHLCGLSVMNDMREYLKIRRKHIVNGLVSCFNSLEKCKETRYIIAAGGMKFNCSGSSNLSLLFEFV